MTDMSQASQWRARKHQEFALNPDMDVEHGKRSTYDNYGCRCDPCKAAKFPKKPELKHGHHLTYIRDKCRCEECRGAMNVRAFVQKENRMRRLRANPSLAPHGRYWTYVGWGCTCEPCTEAARTYRQKQKIRG